MSQFFDSCIDFVLKREGGYVDHPLDSGGPTRWGITIGTLSAHRGHECSKDDVKDLTVKEAREIYKKNYWDVISLDELNHYGKCLCLFDQSVNRGPRTAVRLAQETLNDLGFKVGVDGYMGLQTISALNKADAKKFALKFAQNCVIAYDEIVKKNNSQIVFLVGWHNRVAHLQDATLGI